MNSEYIFKIVLMGDSTVGKTQIFNRLTSEISNKNAKQQLVLIFQILIIIIFKV